MNSLAVLLVEDDANVREYVREVLEISELTVVDVADATAALTVAASARLSIDLLLTDISMPGINGIELARRVQLL